MDLPKSGFFCTVDTVYIRIKFVDLPKSGFAVYWMCLDSEVDSLLYLYRLSEYLDIDSLY